MTKNVEARIALCIIRAQNSSDTGKGIDRISLSKKNSRPCRMGYAFKETPILEAIKLIRNNKTQFNYWVERKPDQNGITSIIVYFDFKIDETRYQVSFHNHGCKELAHYVNTGRRTYWHKKFSSFYSCTKLQEYYQIPQAVVEFDENDSSEMSSHRDENRRNHTGRRTRWC